MTRREPDPSVYNLRPVECEKSFPGVIESAKYWDALQEHSLVIDLAQPDGIESRPDLMRAFLAMYAFVPESQPSLLDAIIKTHGYQECHKILQGIQFSLMPMDARIAEALDDLQLFCRQGGATMLRRFDLSWKNATADSLQTILERFVLRDIEEVNYWKSLSLHDLERWHPLLAARNDFPELSDDVAKDWKAARSFRHGQIYGMLKAQYGVERAVALAARGVGYDYSSDAAWLPLEDVVDVFAQGSLNTLLSFPQQGPGQFMRKVAKLGMGLVSDREDVLDLLKTCERSTLTYWRKANYIDQLTWYRVVGATGKQVDTMMAKDLGL